MGRSSFFAGEKFLQHKLELLINTGLPDGAWSSMEIYLMNILQTRAGAGGGKVFTFSYVSCISHHTRTLEGSSMVDEFRDVKVINS